MYAVLDTLQQSQIGPTQRGLKRPQSPLPHDTLEPRVDARGGYSTLSWVRMCGPKFRPPPYNT